MSNHLANQSHCKNLEELAQRTRNRLSTSERAEQLFLPKRVVGFARRLSRAIIEKDLHRGRRPNVVAAAVIELTNVRLNFGLSKREIAEIAGCTDLALRKVEDLLALELEKIARDKPYKKAFRIES